MHIHTHTGSCTEQLFHTFSHRHEKSTGEPVALAVERRGKSEADGSLAAV